MITCQYCKYLLKSKIISYEDKIRKCIISKNKINALSDSCSSFNPIEYFYCFRYAQRVNMKACISRQDKTKSSYEACYICSQGELIRSMEDIRSKRPKIKRYKIKRLNKINKIKRY